MTGTFVSGDTAALLARVHQFIHTSILWLIRNILKVWKHKPFKQLSKDPEGPRSTQKHPEGKLIRQISQPQSFQAGFITIYIDVQVEERYCWLQCGVSVWSLLLRTFECSSPIISLCSSHLMSRRCTVGIEWTVGSRYSQTSDLNPTSELCDRDETNLLKEWWMNLNLTNIWDSGRKIRIWSQIHI